MKGILIMFRTSSLFKFILSQSLIFVAVSCTLSAMQNSSTIPSKLHDYLATRYSPAYANNLSSWPYPDDNLQGSMTLLHQNLSGHTDWVECLDVFYEEGENPILVSGGFDKTICLHNLNTGELLHVLSGFSNGVWSSCVVPAEKNDGGRVLILGGQGNIWLGKDEPTKTTGPIDDFAILGFYSPLDGSGQGEIAKWFEGHTDGVLAMCGMQKNIFASSADDGTIRVWDLSTCECIKTIHAYAPKGGFGALVRLDDEHVACGSNGKIGIWNIETGQCCHEMNIPTDQVICLKALPDKRLLSWDFGCTVWDWTTGEKLYSFINNPHDPASWGIQSMADYGPNQVLLSKINGNFWVYNYETKELVTTYDVATFGVTKSLIVDDKLIYVIFGFGDGQEMLCIADL